MRYTRFASWHHDVIGKLNWRRDRQWYCERLSQVSGPVCELACGDARLLAPLAEAGKEVWGMDISPEILKIAEADLLKIPGARFHLVHGDLASWELPRIFGAVVLAVNAVGFVHSRQDKAALFRRVRDHLVPGGLFLLDRVTDARSVLGDQQADSGDVFYKEDGKGRWTFRTVYTCPESGVVREWLYWKCIRPDGATVDQGEDYDEFRFLPVLDLFSLVEEEGFEILETYDGFDWEPFERDSQWLALVLQKR